MAETLIEKFDLDAEGIRLYSWGVHKFAFYFKGSQIFELMPRGTYPHAASVMLRLGCVLDDTKGGSWVIMKQEVVPVNARYIQCTPDDLIFSDRGFDLIAYELEPTVGPASVYPDGEISLRGARSILAQASVGCLTNNDEFKAACRLALRLMPREEIPRDETKS